MDRQRTWAIFDTEGEAIYWLVVRCGSINLIDNGYGRFSPKGAEVEQAVWRRANGKFVATILA